MPSPLGTGRRPEETPSLCDRVGEILFPVASFLLIVLSVSAHAIGWDPNIQWGPHRRALLAIGLLLLAYSQRERWVGVVSKLLRTSFRAIGVDTGRLTSQWAELIAPKASLPANSTTGHVSRKSKLALVVTLGVVLPIYVWYVSVGYWDRWPPSTSYYDMLADSFRAGSLALMVEPDPRLASLDDPYPIASRENISVVWDASYFQGRYYLYWGPVPALLIAGLKSFVSVRVGDEVVVFAGMVISTVFVCLSLNWIWRRFFSRLPAWTLLGCLMAGSLAHPTVWILNRPAIHEAAISSGSAFLLASLFVSLPALAGEPIRPARLAAVGSFLGLAVACRPNTLLPVLTLATLLAYRARRAQSEGCMPGRLARGLLALFAPLGLIGLLLATYNFARFQNPLETGWTYVLSGRVEDHRSLADVFNWRYLFPNVASYSLRPYRTLSVFPFVKPNWGRETAAPLPYALPQMYYAEQVTGLLITTPFLLFIYPLAQWLTCRRPKSSAGAKGSIGANELSDSAFRPVAAGLCALAVAAFVPLVFFYSNSTRYLLDVSPFLAILASAGLWLLLDSVGAAVVIQGLISLVAVSTITWGVGVSLLLAITGFELRFETLNPDLFERLSRLFA